MVKAIYTQQGKQQSAPSTENGPSMVPKLLRGMIGLVLAAFACKTLYERGTTVSLRGILQEWTLPSPSNLTCQAWRERTDEWIRAVHEDAESNSLSAVDGIPALDYDLLKRGFGEKTVALLGDSTLFQTLEELHWLLSLPDSTLLGAVSERRNLTPAIQTMKSISGVDRTPVHPVDREQSPNHDSIEYTRPELEGTQIVWVGVRDSDGDDDCRFEPKAFSHIRALRPDVLVANWGHHILHDGTNARPVCNVHQFLHYEDWLQSVVDLAREVGTKVLLFKTTNHICQERYHKYIQEALNDLGLPTFLPRCLFHLKARNNQPLDGLQSKLTDPEMERYCREATAIDRYGPRHLNRRMRDFVVQAQSDPANLNAGLQIEFYNDHDLETCQYTDPGDGLHYRALQLPGLRLMAHMIDCLHQERASSRHG